MKKIAIVIDAWGLKDFRVINLATKETLWTVDSFLRKDYVDTVIMATYSTGESIRKELYNPWIPATKEYFEKNNLSWDQKIKTDSIMLAWDLTKNPHTDKNQLQCTNIGFKHVWRSWRKPILFLHQPWEIAKINEIEEVFFFGTAWDICVKNRPLGYDYWLENTRANLYFDLKGVKATTNFNGFDQYQNSKKYPELKTLREVL